MNWYVLYVFSNKTNKILSNLNQRKELTAFIPKTEVFHRQAKKKTTKDMFEIGRASCRERVSSPV